MTGEPLWPESTPIVLRAGELVLREWREDDDEPYVERSRKGRVERLATWRRSLHEP